MELTAYDIIKGPVISDKAYKLNKKLKQLVLEVHPNATKPLIKDAIEKVFNVKIKEVRTTIRKKWKKKATASRHKAQPTRSKKKIAYVTLSEGYTLNLFEQAGIPSGEESKKQNVKD